MLANRRLSISDGCHVISGIVSAKVTICCPVPLAISSAVPDCGAIDLIGAIEHNTVTDVGHHSN